MVTKDTLKTSVGFLATAACTFAGASVATKKGCCREQDELFGKILKAIGGGLIGWYLGHKAIDYIFDEYAVRLKKEDTDE